MTVNMPSSVVELKLDRLIDDMRFLKSHTIAFDTRLREIKVYLKPTIDEIVDQRHRRRAARRSSGDKPLMERSSMRMASILRTASKAIGEIVVGFPLRAFETMSASSNSLRLACAQHPASVITPGFRSGLYTVLNPA
jgi:hypothetical protein